MRSPTAALGSLAALASLVASPDASAQLTLSSLSDMDLSDYNNGVLALDIDGDSVTDFNISVYNSFSADLNPLGSNAVVGSGGLLDVKSLGDTIHMDLNYNSYGSFDNFVSGGSQYVGVQFDISGNTHYGWLEFDFPSIHFIQGSLVSAAWQATPGHSATISATSAVPEPADAGLLAGLFAAFAGFFRRRRRLPGA